MGSSANPFVHEKGHVNGAQINVVSLASGLYGDFGLSLNRVHALFVKAFKDNCDIS